MWAVLASLLSQLFNLNANPADKSGFTNCVVVEPEENKRAAPKLATPITSLFGARRKALEDYFTLYAPERLDTIPKLLSNFKGKEVELFKKLEEKYGHPVVIPEQATGHSMSPNLCLP